MVLAQNTGQNQALDQFRAQYKIIAAQLAALRVQASQADMPFTFLLKLDRLSDAALATGKELGADVSGVLKGGATLARLLPWLLLLAVVVVGVGFYRGSLKVTR